MARANNLIPSDKPDAMKQIAGLLETKGISPVDAANQIEAINRQAELASSADKIAASRGSAVASAADVNQAVARDGKLDLSGIKASDEQIQDARAAIDQLNQVGDQKVS